MQSTVECSGPPGVPLPPSRTVTLVEPEPFDVVPPTSMAAPQPRPQMPAASTAQAGTQSRIHAADHTGNEPFSNLVPVVLPMTRFGAPKPASLTFPSQTLSVTSCTTSTASLCSNSQETQHRNPHRNLWRLPHGDHVLDVSGQFHANTNGNDLAILLNKDTFVSGSAVFPITEPPTSKDTWGLAALVVRGLLRRPSVADSSHSHIFFAEFTSTIKSPRSVMQPHPSCTASMLTGCDTTLTSSEVTPT